MKSLFKYTVFLILLVNSLPAFSQDEAPSTSSSGPGERTVASDQAANAMAPITQAAEPANAPPKEPTGYNPQDVMKYYSETLVPMLSKYPEVLLRVKDKLSTLDKDLKDYAKNQDSCKTREDNANTFCMETRSPSIRNMIAMTQVLTAGLSGMLDACKKFTKVMDAGNKALTVYQTGCSTARGVCMSACSSAVKNVQAAEKHADALSTDVAVAAKEAAQKADQKVPGSGAPYIQLATQFENSTKTLINDYLERELKKENKFISVAEKQAVCDGYAKELASAALGALSMVKSFGEANKCSNQTNGNQANASPTPVDCTIAANKTTIQECICKDNQRLPGCNSGLDSPNQAKAADVLRAANGAGYTAPGGTSSPGGLDGGPGNGLDMASKGNDGGGGGAPGAPVGGGGAGLGGDGGGFGGGKDGGAAQKGSGLNTNILAGEGGGGGGGGWGGGGYEGGGGALRQYLPGGAKDPRLGAAGMAKSKEVTSQGGKSNWEKVTDRYRDNKPSLLGY